MTKKIVLALAAAGMLAGCADGRQPGPRAGAGAAIGAVVGAVTGVLIARDDRVGGLVGAGIGAVAGAAIGDYLDRQQEELEKNLEGTGATVTNTGEELLVNLPESITFDFDRADIKPEFYDALGKVSSTLNNYEESLIDIVGHTDSVGSDEYNQRLSQRRADAVSSFMQGRGVISQRIVAYGQGETNPVATNDTESGRAQNRRVELIISPVTES
ncbi:MAG: OmpA family protein [Pseudomonadota bacterium]